jgi:simple sugar transport system permease protein
MEALLLSTIRMTTPVLFAALGELCSEKAGLVNIGLDGIMVFGALAGFLTSYITGSPLLGIIAGAFGGILINLIYAFCTITLRAEQIVYGMAINIFAPAIASFIYKIYFGISSTLQQTTLMPAFPIPGLNRIPLLGPVLFKNTPVVYFLFLLLPASFIFFTKTRAGLNYRSVGEYPQAAESLGIDVVREKYIACIICGALSGIGGAYLTTCYIPTYTDGVVAGRGFIALSAVIFGRWTSIGVGLASLLFGFADALQLRFQIIKPEIPYQFMAMLPYICTLCALAFFGIKKNGPKANGKAYYREQR